MIYYCGTSLYRFYIQYAKHKNVKWFAFGNLYFVCDKETLNDILLKLKKNYDNPELLKQ